MSLQIGIGSFSKTAGTGTQSVTGLVDQNGEAFVPKAFIFTSSGNMPGNGFNDSAHAYWMNGFDDLTNVRCVSTRSLDNSSALHHADGDMVYNNQTLYTKLASIMSPDTFFVGSFTDENRKELAGKVTSAASGSFVVTWSASSSTFTGMRVDYMAIGGSGISVKVGSGAISGTGTKTLSGIGFTPTAIFTTTAGCLVDHSIASAQAYQPYWSPSFGMANAAGCQGAIAGFGTEAVVQRNNRVQLTNKCVAAVVVLNTLSVSASITSMQSDSFTVNYAGNAVDTGLAYLALSGCTVAMGSFSRPATFGNRSRISGLGITPKAVILATVGAASSSSVQTEARLSLSYHSAQDQLGSWVGLLDNVTPTKNAEYHSAESGGGSGVIAATPVAAGGSSTLLSKVTSVIVGEDDSFDVYWSGTPVETVQTQYLVAALGDTGTQQSSCGFIAVDVDTADELALLDTDSWELQRFDMKVRSEEKS